MTTVTNAVVLSGSAREPAHDDQGFLRYMPTVGTPAAISFRPLPQSGGKLCRQIKCAALVERGLATGLQSTGA